MPFTHSCGHKPLAGYTIKRGISTGGFGEVYFGLTDGGKEVALKRLVRHQDIELRGIRQCLNLKHAHLVHLYDLKTDDRGDHWLVMEYIRGETLHSLLRKHPQGLPHDLIRPWFDQLAAAVHSLHEQGIVHRDLKPANVFLEAGLVKVGDYGLCKFIGASQHRAQSQNVGTVHYMAPEIGKGDYSRPIDIYAGGILLYEMVTGNVPFDGETTAEILFKHLSATPDLSKTGPFAPILAKALEKAPTDRFASIAEMARRVTETNLDQPRTTFVPAAPVTMTALPTATSASAASTIVLSKPTSASALPRRLATAGAWVAWFSLLWAAIFLDDAWRMLPAFVLAMAGSWGVILLARSWPAPADDSLSRRLLLGLLGVSLGLAAVWLQGYQVLGGGDQSAHLPRVDAVPPSPIFSVLYPNNRSLSVLAGHVAYYGLMFAILRWWHITEPLRPAQFSWPSLLATAFWAYVLLFLLPTAEERLIGFATMTQMAAAIQLASPRRDPDPAPSKRVRLRWA
jgi:hypothetical protein